MGRVSVIKTFKDRNRARYSYREVIKDQKVKLESKPEDIFLISAGTSAEVKFGSAIFTNEDKKTIAYNMTFAAIPSFIATPNTSVKLSVDSQSVGSATIYASDKFTGIVYWLAVNKTVDNLNIKYAMIAQGNRESFNNKDEKAITFDRARKALFTDHKRVTGELPTILLMPEDNVYLHVGELSTSGFTAHASDVTSNSFHWLAIVVRNL